MFAMDEIKQDEINKGCGPDWLPTRRKTLDIQAHLGIFRHEGVAPRANAIWVLFYPVAGWISVTKYEQTLLYKLQRLRQQRRQH